MKLSSLISINKHDVNCMPVLLLLALLCNSNTTFADSITYSPDQLPRKWNVLINEMHNDQKLNGHGQKNGIKPYKPNASRNKPSRSTAWGVPPVKKKNSHRSRSPEYNTQMPRYSYPMPMNGYGAYYPGLAGFGLSPYSTPFMVPGMSPLLAPGLSAPGIPLSLPYAGYPYSPGYMGLFPGMIY